MIKNGNAVTFTILSFARNDAEKHAKILQLCFKQKKAISKVLLFFCSNVLKVKLKDIFVAGVNSVRRLVKLTQFFFFLKT